MPQRVAILTSTFPPYRGGIGKVAEVDANQLAAAGHDVTVFTPTPDGHSDPPYRVERIKPLFRYGNAAFCPGLRRLWTDYDLVLLHYPFYGGAEPLLWQRPKRGGAKLALVYHMDTVGRGLIGVCFALHRRWVLPWIVRQADTLIATTLDYLKHSDVAQLAKRPGLQVRDLAPAVDVERFAPGARPPELLVRHGLGLADRIVLHVGGLDRAHYFKGVPNLLKALATDGLREVKAVIVGQGELRQEFSDLARRLGISGRVIFAGPVSEADLPKYYRLADAFAFPSTDKSEAFGIAALEAMACGVPVVASNFPGVRVIVRDGQTGWRCQPGSVSSLAVRLTDLLADPDTRQRFGETARKMAVLEYSESVRATKLESIVSELLG
jgi:glycosyltransferase involved in cell wall biosynthesis